MPILKSDIGGMSEGLYDIFLLCVKVKDIFFSVSNVHEVREDYDADVSCVSKSKIYY